MKILRSLAILIARRPSRLLIGLQVALGALFAVMLVSLLADRLFAPHFAQPLIPPVAFGIVGGALVILFALGAAVTKELPAPGSVAPPSADSPMRILGSSLLSLGVGMAVVTSLTAPDMHFWIVLGLIVFGAGAFLLVLSGRDR